MKNNLCILVAVSGNLAFSAANIAMALNRYMKTPYELLVYSGDMAESDKTLLNAIPNTKVIAFNFEPGFIQHMMSNLPENCRFKDTKKLMRFCHYEAFKLLDQYTNVVWLDCDMSVQKDLSPILQYVPFGMTLDTPWTVGNQFIKPVDGFDMEKSAFCSGTMMLNDKLPYMDIYHWLYENTKKYAPSMKNGDQAIINLMIQKFNIEPIAMPLEEWQCICWKKEAIDARVVHFGTDRKVWTDNMILCSFPEWYRIHQEWLNLGGSDFDRTNIQAQNIYPLVRGKSEECDNLKKKTKELNEQIQELQKRYKEKGIIDFLHDYIPIKKQVLISAVMKVVKRINS